MLIIGSNQSPKSALQICGVTENLLAIPFVSPLANWRKYESPFLGQEKLYILFAPFPPITYGKEELSSDRNSARVWCRIRKMSPATL